MERRRRTVGVLTGALCLATTTVAAAVMATMTTIGTAHATNPDPIGAGPDTPFLATCPIDGDSTFDDSWGAPRSGGRRHEGVDMISDRGTPVVAVRDGDAHFKRSRLGGNSVWLTTDDGTRFFYAHLDHFAGESRRVEAGEPIGYVGSTGNARGPHLHFETHPGGTVVNPFPAVHDACTPPIAIDESTSWLCDESIAGSPFAAERLVADLLESCPDGIRRSGPPPPPSDPGV